MEAGANLAEDWGQIVELLEDSTPCNILLRLNPVDGDGDAPAAGDDDWCMCPWTPDCAPVKSRMVASSTQKTLKEHFGSLQFISNYPMTEKPEATYEAWKAATRTLSDSERREAMTQQERDQEDAMKASEQERAKAPNRQVGLAGLGSMTIILHDSFREAVAALAAGKAVIAKVEGEREKNSNWRNDGRCAFACCSQRKTGR